MGIASIELWDSNGFTFPSISTAMNPYDLSLLYEFHQNKKTIETIVINSRTEDLDFSMF